MRKLKKILSVKSNGDSCSGGFCPTIYSDEEGNFYVQGNKVDKELKQGVPVNEDIVLIPKELLLKFKGEI